MDKCSCPFCLGKIRPITAEAEAAEWAFRLADATAPGGSRGGVVYRLNCPTCAVPLVAAPGLQWTEVDPAVVEWSRDLSAHLICGGPLSERVSHSEPGALPEGI
jgi:hypothetical protein